MHTNDGRSFVPKNNERNLRSYIRRTGNTVTSEIQRRCSENDETIRRVLRSTSKRKASTVVKLASWCPPKSLKMAVKWEEEGEQVGLDLETLLEGPSAEQKEANGREPSAECVEDTHGLGEKEQGSEALFAAQEVEEETEYRKSGTRTRRARRRTTIVSSSFPN